ncbi:hypothetical protein M8C17_20920 [Micromonospora sp. RHAY321]|uniref:hypothetical protein n=1 Tax=Micromonospora sp. RHAY321 TaxID=2944807 RepID=UPI00207CC8B9|nr:hypothetical protein [Micromonospora sp. RHAY321]MCO1597618.1 hypothetical protein [Micromonospora sp. RHAY321]
MSSRCYVGTADPHQPHLAHARFVLFDGYPAAVIPALAGIWAGHARRDTHVLVAAVLAHDWEYLDPTITGAATSGFAGQHPVAGVGMTLAATSPDGTVEAPEPVSVFPLSQAAHLDAAWIYLIDPAADAIAVHTDDGEPAARYHLDACAAPKPSAPYRAEGAIAHPWAAHHCCVPTPGVPR